MNALYKRRRECRLFWEQRVLCSLGAVLLMTTTGGSAGGQDSQHRTPPVASPPSQSSAQPLPRLSADVAKEVAGDEVSIFEAFQKVDDLELVNTAIPKAERVFRIRAAQQGETWWETF